MDFSQFDERGRDEAGTPHPILHPDTGAPIIDPETGAPCMVLVRGITAPSVVAAEVARSRSGMFTPEAAKHLTLPEAHDKAVEVALPFIAGFQNVNRGDRPATEEDAAWFLGMNMPRLGTGPDGEITIANKTFAQQILDIVQQQRAALGNAPAP
jgi:hypothetical protein